MSIYSFIAVPLPSTKVKSLAAGISTSIVSPTGRFVLLLYNCNCNLPQGVTCNETEKPSLDDINN